MNRNNMLLGCVLVSLVGVWGCAVGGLPGMIGGQLAGAALNTGVGMLAGGFVPSPHMLAQPQPMTQKVITNNCETKPDGQKVCTESTSVVTMIPQSASNSPITVPSSRSSPPAGYKEVSASVSEKDPCTDWANRAFYKGCWGK